LSTSATDKRRRIVKISAVYLLISVLCIVITIVYARFGHGIRSYYMDLMFLYPLIGGAAAVIIALVRRGFSRLGFNLFNSGIAALTAGSLLQGVVEIAGTSSEYIILFYVFGGLFALVGLVFLLREVT